MTSNRLLAISIFIFLMSCDKKPSTTDDTYAQLRQLTSKLTDAEIADDIKTFMSLYHASAVSMPDYQPMLINTVNIESFYSEIFKRQDIKVFQRNPEEFIDLDSTTVIFGTFHKEFVVHGTDSIVTLDGKYCQVWKRFPDGRFKLSAETFGFFRPIDNPESLVVRQLFPKGVERYDEANTPVELRAYNALMEKYVSRSGSGALRAAFFTDDGKVYPFAHEPVATLDSIKPYLVRYDTHGPGFKFDTVSVTTYRYEYHEPGVLEIQKFYVRWSAPGASGGASGQGIRVWVRQDDFALKLYREIGTHDLE